MSEFKGTPGPWLVCEGATHITVRGDNGEAIFHDDKSIDGVREDARLIASAPALLEAAQIALSIAESWIHDQLDGTSQLEIALRELSPVRDAIARALGE